MGNPFSSSGASVGSSLSGIGSALTGGGGGGGAGAGSGVAQQPGLMSLFQNLVSGPAQGPGLYTPGALSQSQIATSSPTQMNEMQPPVFNPAWGTSTDPWASVSPATSTPGWGQPTQ
jgi:hypothetical protein